MINTDKAYILGLVIGGGGFNSNFSKFYIKLPYKQWGDVEQNPKRAGLIAKDILKVISPLMKVEYGLNVSYTTGREWRIECVGDTSKLTNDLLSYGIQPSSNIRRNADISFLSEELKDDNLKRRFIAGLADTIGSVAPSQRRFSDDVQIISFEITGFAFEFICQLCNLLYAVGCLPDQVLWQHPNIQSGNDAYYRQWKKGNKIRVTLDSFSKFGALAFKSKTIASHENIIKQSKVNVAEKCEEKHISFQGVTALHIDENSSELPENIRGGHYLHHKHICAVLNCPHAPYESLQCALEDAENHISPFTVLTKGSAKEIRHIVQSQPILENRNYREEYIRVKDVLDAYNDGGQTILFKDDVIYSDDSSKGYPLNYVIKGMAYIIASEMGKLNGRRIRGSQVALFDQCLNDNPMAEIKVLVPDLLTPIIITDNYVSAMVGPLNATVYRKLIDFDKDNKYKMILRPIREEDLEE